MNLPNSVVRHVLSTVALIFRSMAYIPERFADHCNDRRLTESQLLRRASVKRKPCGSPTKNGCANLTPLRFCRYFTDNDARACHQLHRAAQYVNRHLLQLSVQQRRLSEHTTCSQSQCALIAFAIKKESPTPC